MRRTPGTAVWHRNYYEHIVRDEADINRIRRYIRNNPANYDVLRYGEPRFIIGNPDIFDLPKTAFLASRPRTGDRRVASFPDRRDAFPDRQLAFDSLFKTSPDCVISSFLSPMERQIFNDCLAKTVPLLQVLPRGLPDELPNHVQRAVDTGHLLIITPFPKSVSYANAARAAWCNQYLLHLAESIVIGHLNPGGILECLLSDMSFDKAVVMPPANNCSVIKEAT